MIREMISDIKERKYFVGKYSDIVFYATDHFLEREMERSDISPKEFETMLNKIAKELDNEGYDSDIYLFYVKEFQQGFILKWQPEIMKVLLITYLPRYKKDSSKNKTKRIIIESYNDIIEYYFDKIKDYLWIDKDINESKPARGVNCDFMIDVTIL